MNNEEINYQLIKFEDGDFSLDVYQLIDDNTIWLTTNQMSKLFDKTSRTIINHIKRLTLLRDQRSTNALFLEEQRKSNGNSNGNNNVRYFRVEGVDQKVATYSIEVVEYIGKRIRSNRLDTFLKWVSGLNYNTNISAINSEKTYELVKFQDGDFSLDVNVSPDEDTVWLTQNDIALLFDTTKQNISRHIKNIFSDNELKYVSVVKDCFTTATDGKVYKVTYYNLDMILSIGYRVRSSRGNKFRIWANSILKQYLFNGSSINKDRLIAYQSNILNLESDLIDVKNRIKGLEETVYSINNKIIFEGEILEPYSFIIKLFFTATKRIVVIDSYADDFLLKMLNHISVPITIYTSTSSYLNKHKEDIKNNMTIINTDVFHDRYITIDNKTYIIGSSINSIGKKRFTISILKDIPLEKIIENINKK